MANIKYIYKRVGLQDKSTRGTQSTRKKENIKTLPKDKKTPANTNKTRKEKEVEKKGAKGKQGDTPQEMFFLIKLMTIFNVRASK
jgi:hypothetical protein